MSIPPHYDKWILFGFALCMERVVYLPGHGLQVRSIPRSLLEGALEIAAAAIVTALFVAISAGARWLSDRLSPTLTYPVRLAVNGMFALLILASCIAIPTHAVLVSMPSAP